jgi:hypothetical protein
MSNAILTLNLETSTSFAAGTISFKVPGVGPVRGPVNSVLVLARMEVAWDLADDTSRELLGHALGQDVSDWQGLDDSSSNVSLNDDALKGLLRALVDGVDGRIDGFRFPGASQPPSPASHALGAALLEAALECAISPDVRLGAGFDLELHDTTVTKDGAEQPLDAAGKKALCRAFGVDGDDDPEELDDHYQEVRVRAPRGATLVINAEPRWDGCWTLDGLELSVDDEEIGSVAALEAHGVTILTGPCGALDRKRRKKQPARATASRKKAARGIGVASGALDGSELAPWGLGLSPDLADVLTRLMGQVTEVKVTAGPAPSEKTRAPRAAKGKPAAAGAKTKASGRAATPSVEVSREAPRKRASRPVARKPKPERP